MSCYHPRIGIPDIRPTSNGKIKYRIVGDYDPQRAKQQDPDSILIPCGKCIGCRLDYSRRWADRMMLELDSNDGKAVFCTLTYNNENLTLCKFDDNGIPIAGTLVKRDVQLFMKRLRKVYSPRLLRFYCAGEYGSKTFRPHYHLIIFGISLENISDIKQHGQNKLKQPYFESEIWEHIWNNGYVLLTNVSYETCAYVARYVTKKVQNNDLFREYQNQLPEFSLMSRKPGIGKQYMNEHPDCLDYQFINISTPEGGLKISIPKYFIDQLKNEKSPWYNQERYDEIIEERKKLGYDKTLVKVLQQDLPWLEYLEQEENKKLKSIVSLERNRADKMSYNLY